MKVCLINPILFSFQQVRGRSLRNNMGMSFYPPLGLCYIANFLEKNGIDVKIIDRNVLMTKNNCRRLVVDSITANKIAQFGPDIVGVTITTPTFFDVKHNIIRIVREVNQSARVVVGGPHVSALPEDTLQAISGIDIACRGEGEIVMLEIAQGKALEKIDGISYRDGQAIINNQCREPHTRVDDFCFPARHLVDMKFYSKRNPYVIHGLYLRSTTIFTSRGCPYNCTFCAGPVAMGRKVRSQSTDLVIEEIERLAINYEMEGLYFADDIFDVNKERAATICRKLINLKLNKRICWNAQLRANSMDKDLLKLMKEAGCVQVDVGFESGSQKILDIIDKKTTVGQNYEAARMLREISIPLHANIIVGLPGEDIEDLSKTRKFMEEINPRWIGFGEFVPLPGSKLFNELVAAGRTTVEEVETLGSFNFTKIDDKTLDRLIKHFRSRIVVPTRIKHYLMDNIKRPGAYFYLLGLVFDHFIDKCKMTLRLS